MSFLNILNTRAENFLFHYCSFYNLPDIGDSVRSRLPV